MIVNQQALSFIGSRNPQDYSPFYLYLTKQIREQVNAFMNLSYPEKSIHFATMANINPSFLAIVKARGMHVFVNSLSHLRAVMAAGFRSDQILYTASALSPEIMRVLAENHIHTNLDSPMQLEQWIRMFPGQKVGIRCNIGELIGPKDTGVGYFQGKESRLGFTISEIESIRDKSVINCLHLYVGTDLSDVGYFIRSYRQLLEISRQFPEIESINFGGGFSIGEDNQPGFDLAAYDAQLNDLMEEFNATNSKSMKIVLEPGRIIGAASAYFVCRVTDIKKQNGMIRIGTSASATQFTRTLLYPETARHPVALVRNGIQITEPNLQTVDIFGCSTYSRDYLARDAQIPEPQPGDYLLFGNAGSYCASSHIEFLGFPKAEEFFI